MNFLCLCEFNKSILTRLFWFWHWQLVIFLIDGRKQYETRWVIWYFFDLVFIGPFIWGFFVVEFRDGWLPDFNWKNRNFWWFLLWIDQTWIPELCWNQTDTFRFRKSSLKILAVFFIIRPHSVKFKLSGLTLISLFNALVLIWKFSVKNV